LREKQVSPQELQQVNVDTTVQEKNITYPTDSNLFYKAIVKLAKAAKSRGVRLRQSYVRVAKIAAIKASRYAHAKQFRRMQRQLRFLRTRLGRVLRDFGRMVAHPDEALRDLLKLCWRLFRQQPQDKHKLYSLDEPEVECISKGKAHKRYEFGQKISIATTNRRNWVLAAMLCPDNPYDGHTLQATLAAAERNSGVRPTAAFVDKGYRGHGCHGDTQIHIAGASNKDASRILRKRRRRRSAIEPLIGHMKSDHRMDRCFLKGLLGDAINAVLAAAGRNFRKLLRCVFALIFGLVWAAAWWKRPSRCVPRLAAAA
jgi:IS5 family transposase